GSSDSMFILLYVLLIIISSLYLYRTGAYVISLGSVVAFLGLLLVESRGTENVTQFVAYRFYIFGLLFMLAGILSGMLSERYRKRAEEAARLRVTTEEIIRNLPSGIITVAGDGTILYTNIPEGPLRAKVHLHIAKFLNEENITNMIEIRTDDRYYVFNCARIAKTEVGLGILQDYTEIKTLEERSRIAQQTKLLAELSGSLAHEIRNPLASIRGSLEVIREAERNKEAKHFIDMALKETIRLNEIVTDFLSFSQFVPKKKNRLAIKDVISEALLDVMQRIEDGQINIKRIDENFHVLGDMNKLKACFINLVLNAYEAGDKQQTIEITTRIENRKGIVIIQDHGKGIPEGLRQRIFDPFFTTKKGGTGLGLAITQNIIEAHEGTINLESTVDAGSIFTIALPLA
ncbi:GHKL domain-containing protein, partial [candidate division WOR-3 bacterium]|nr:GHKL domain-containing protein [candidate division WOR-3 bacterium]